MPIPESEVILTYAKKMSSYSCVSRHYDTHELGYRMPNVTKGDTHQNDATAL